MDEYEQEVSGQERREVRGQDAPRIWRNQGLCVQGHQVTNVAYRGKTVYKCQYLTPPTPQCRNFLLQNNSVLITEKNGIYYIIFIYYISGFIMESMDK